MSERKIDILMDCDGILADFVGGVIAHLNDRYGSEIFNRDQIDQWDIAKCLGRRDGEIFEIASIENFCATLDPLPGAQEGVKALKKIGNVYIVTSPIWSSKTWMHERAFWLHNQFDIRMNNIIQTSAKHLVEGDLFVDDSVPNVERWQEHRKGYGLLWSTPWNAKVESHCVRVENWNTLRIAAERIAAMWEGEYIVSPSELIADR